MMPTQLQTSTQHSIVRCGLPRVALTVAFLAVTSTASAITIRHDVPESQYFALADQFPAVGRLDDDFGALCTGTLVTPTKVLTAAHCVDGLNGPLDNQSDLNIPASSFNLGADVGSPTTSVGISSVAVNTWNGNANGDMAVLTLSQPITNVTPVSVTSLDPANMLGTMVGFGLHGTGQNFSFQSDDLRRAAQNIIDVANGTVETDFDNAAGNRSTYGSSAAVALEGTTARGDSGGPIVADFGFGPSIVGVLNGGFNPFGTESEYGDISIWASARRQANVNFLTNNGITVIDSPNTVTGDFDNDGDFDCTDVDSLTAAIAASSTNVSYDVSGDGLVDADDLTAWLSVAGANNLPSGSSYLPGDANLDGNINGEDFLQWNASKFSNTPSFCSGDFNADGNVNGADFLLWNENKFTSADVMVASAHRPRFAAVPEPSSLMGLCMALAAFAFRRQTS
jgi:hypothetical protein